MSKIIKIKRSLVLFEPIEYFSDIYKSDRDIINDLSHIQMMKSEVFIIKKLLRIFFLIDDKKLKPRSAYLKQKILRTIRIHKRNLSVSSFESNINSGFFKIFQKYVFFKTYADLVNSILIDISLNQSQIEWLIDNYSENKHILNRILRYPEPNETISRWAIQSFKENLLSDRKSELISKFITNPLQKYLDNESRRNLFWAIYYSQLKKRDKKSLLDKLYNDNDIDSWLKVVIKLKYSELLKQKLS